MEQEGAETPDESEEVVFVLRLRLGESGWRGVVQRLGSNGMLQPRFVGGTNELYSLLERDWQTIRAGRQSRLLAPDNPGEELS